MALKGRTQLNMQVREENKTKLKEITDYERERTNPNMSMTLVVELMITKRHRELKLGE